MSDATQNYLVIIHSSFTGDGLRQVVVSADSAEQAISKISDRVGSAEHAIAIPTGSEPDFEVNKPNPVDTEAAEEVSTPEADTAEGTATIPDTDKSSMLAELGNLPHEVLAKILAAVKGE